MLGSMESGAVGGFMDGYVGSGGNLRDGEMGAVDGAAMGFLGGLSYAPGAGGVVEKGLLEGAVGGVTTEAAGGSFVGGFAGAFSGAVMEPGLSYGSLGQDVLSATIASVVGGGVSLLSGGSFANGAWSAAFQQMFNDLAHIIEKQVARLKNNQVWATKGEASVVLTSLAPPVEGAPWKKMFAVNVITVQDQKFAQILLERLAEDEGKMAWGRVLLNIGIGSEGNLDSSPTIILEDGGESILREELSLKTFHWIMSHSGIGVGATFRSSHSLRYMFIQRLDHGQWP